MNGKMSLKKTMFVIWVAVSLLWAAFSAYMFDVQHTKYIYANYTRFEEKVAQGRKGDPLRWDYNKRGYKRMRKEVSDLNKDLGLFFLVGFGLPGIMLAVGTIALENVDKPKKRKKA